MNTGVCDVRAPFGGRISVARTVVGGDSFGRIMFTHAISSQQRLIDHFDELQDLRYQVDNTHCHLQQA